MRRYSAQPRDSVFVKGNGFLSFGKYIGRNVSKNIGKNLSGKYSQKLLNHAKQSVTDVLKTASKRAILIGNQIVDKITKVLKILPHNYLEKAESEMKNAGFDRELSKETYV